MIRGEQIRLISAQGASNVNVRQADSAESVIALEPDPKALLVRLEPDVAKAFPTAEAVNEGLRSLMRASEKKSRRGKPRIKRRSVLLEINAQVGPGTVTA